MVFSLSDLPYTFVESPYRHDEEGSDAPVYSIYASTHPSSCCSTSPGQKKRQVYIHHTHTRPHTLSPFSDTSYPDGYGRDPNPMLIQQSRHLSHAYPYLPLLYVQRQTHRRGETHKDRMQTYIYLHRERDTYMWMYRQQKNEGSGGICSLSRSERPFCTAASRSRMQGRVRQEYLHRRLSFCNEAGKDS